MYLSLKQTLYITIQTNCCVHDASDHAAVRELTVSVILTAGRWKLLLFPPLTDVGNAACYRRGQLLFPLRRSSILCIAFLSPRLLCSALFLFLLDFDFKLLTLSTPFLLHPFVFTLLIITDLYS